MLSNKDIPTENVQKLIELSEKEEERKIKKSGQYTQWLEWTVGLESEFIILNGARLILGFAYGIKTPLKFWEESNPKEEGVSDDIPSISTGGNLDDLGMGYHEKSMYSTSTNVYLKIPL